MDIERLAEAVRRETGYLELPVDVGGIARELKITIRQRRWRGLPNEICVLRPRLIILKASRSRVQRRFDLAHAIFHFVLLEAGHSQAANLFASALLMPRREFESAVIQHGLNGYVTHLFGVSWEAARLRRGQIGRLDIVPEIC